MKHIFKELCMATSIKLDQLDAINIDLNLNLDEMEMLYEIIGECIQEERLKRMNANLYITENGVLREKTEDELLDEYADEYYKSHQFEDVTD